MVAFGLTTFSQEVKNGTVYKKHPVLQKVNNLWTALINNDKEAYGNLLADSVMVVFNGNRQKKTKEETLNSLDWWNKEFENLKVVIDTPAYADAIDYKKGGMWVQDWLRVTATNKETGINLNFRTTDPRESIY